MDTQLTISVVSSQVHIRANGIGAGMDYSTALALRSLLRMAGMQAESYARVARAGGDTTGLQFDRENVLDIAVESAGPAVIVTIRGGRWFEFNYRTTDQILKSLSKAIAPLEEIAKAEQLIGDEAILLRTGLPIGLAQNRRIKREAWKKAEDVKIPGGVIPQAVFYPPTITVHPPRAVQTTED